jgi:hypothetical protein
MRAAGTPLLITSDGETELKRIKIGGKDGKHNEQWLQQIVHRHPTCLPMDQIEPGFSTLHPICMELPVPSGFVDNLLMTAEGDIVIVEAKLWGNPQARREVVAQALEYANNLFGMDYAAFEQAVLKADHDGRGKPTSLYGMFGDADTLDEPAFVDAVTMNLCNGRIVVLIAGDGIRTDAEALVSSLQSHGGFHFTFALVELAVFAGQNIDEYIVAPRTIAQTVMIERGIVRVQDDRVSVTSVQGEGVSVAPKSHERMSITSESFYDAMRNLSPALPDQIEALVGQLSKLGVYADFQRSLNFKWDGPHGKPINLGYIVRQGEVWTDMVGQTLTDKTLARDYVDDLAHRTGTEVKVFEKSGNATVAINGSPPKIQDFIERGDAWAEAIESFMDRMNERAQSQDQ